MLARSVHDLLKTINFDAEESSHHSGCRGGQCHAYDGNKKECSLLGRVMVAVVVLVVAVAIVVLIAAVVVHCVLDSEVERYRNYTSW